MIKSIKNYLEDYSEAQKACNAFNKKHWKGNIVVVLMTWLITFMSFGGAAIIKDKIEEKKLQKMLKETEDNE